MARWKRVAGISTDLVSGLLESEKSPLQFLCPFCYL